MNIQYEPKKFRLSVNRGTKIMLYDYKKPNWAGETFHDHETERFEKAMKMMTSTSKGTHRVQLGSLKRKRPLSPKGRFISTSRGTSRAKIN